MNKFLFILLLVNFSFAQEVEGFWKTVDEDGKAKSIVKIYKTESNTLEGKIVRILNEDRRGILCDKCEGDKKDKPVEGLVIIEDLIYKDEEWKKGTIVDPQNGKTYDCKIWVDDDDASVLNVRGYWGFFYRTQTWQRVDSADI
jgi:uncharacterized protein (DUF2147 family)